ncbi:MAG: hypothetical protein H0W78_01360 [Planctomycetes bacterium]|nr:hypothetical protein [Planctomycetota bacterium]
MSVDENFTKKTALNRSFKWISGILGSLFAALLITYASTKLIDHMNASTELETLSTFEPAAVLKGNLDLVSKIKIGGKEYGADSIYCLTIYIANRTSKNIESLSAKIKVREKDMGGNPINIIHKVILYPDSFDGSWISWGDDVKSPDPELSLKVLNSSWETKDWLSVRIFVEGSSRPGIQILSPNPGVTFVPYDTTKTHWVFFGLDAVIITLVILVVFFLVMLLAAKLGSYQEKRREAVFLRVVLRSLSHYQNQNKELTPVVLAAACLFAKMQSTYRFRLSKEHDMIMKHEVANAYLQKQGYVGDNETSSKHESALSEDRQ